MLLLLLSCFSRVWLCATPETAARQGPLSLGFSRREHWSGLPFPSPMHEGETWKWSRSGCLLESYTVVSNSEQPHGLQSTRLLRPWDFPGKSTGVGCHCLLQQCMRVPIFPHPWQHLLFSAFALFSHGQLNWDEVILLYGFDFHFPDD